MHLGSGCNWGWGQCTQGWAVSAFLIRLHLGLWCNQGQGQFTQGSNFVGIKVCLEFQNIFGPSTFTLLNLAKNFFEQNLITQKYSQRETQYYNQDFRPDFANFFSCKMKEIDFQTSPFRQSLILQNIILLNIKFKNQTEYCTKY